MSWETATLIGFATIAVIFTFLSIKFDEKHIFLKLTFFFLTFISFIISLNVLKEIVVLNDIVNSINIIYFGSIILVTLLFSYFFLYFVYSYFNNRKREREVDYDEQE